VKVLIAIDDSDCSDLALQSVSQNCWTTGTQFIIVTVIEPFSLQHTVSEAYYLEAAAQAQQDYSKYCQQFINSKVDHLKTKFVESKVEGKVIEGDVASSIIQEAEDQNVDLIVIGSHGRRGLQKFLLGSVAEKVVSHAPCSVQIAKQKIIKEKSDKTKERVMFGV
jgi:nucleotide-binding universal stress UspA family protein